MHSVSIGTSTNAEGLGSTAFGSHTKALKDYTTVMGVSTTAHSAYETVVGRYNLEYNPNDQYGWNGADHLFVIGNGTGSDTSRSNALTVLKNGNTGIGTASPSAQFHTDGSVRFEGAGTPGVGKVLTSDAGGNATWQPGIPTYQIGDFAHGGVVFYVEPCGTKGLVCAIQDQDGGSGIKWRGGSDDYNTMARGSQIYGGKFNTSIIIAVHAAKDDFDDHAALVCANYTSGYFGDWYLPTPSELYLMYLNRIIINNTAIANGGSAFSEAAYWSSQEDNADKALKYGFVDGITSPSFKYLELLVRAVRAF
jgi:hypothetical protein